MSDMTLGLIVFAVLFLFPCLIVIFWKSRPVAAMLTALFIWFLFMAGLIHLGESSEPVTDPIYSGLWFIVVGGLFLTIPSLPVLFVVQFIARRKYKRQLRDKTRNVSHNFD